jgi:hypothetical protein
MDVPTIAAFFFYTHSHDFIRTPMKYTQEFLKMSHIRSIFQYEEIAQSVFCGCFYCLRVFTREDIVECTDEDSSKGKTDLQLLSLVTKQKSKDYERNLSPN